MTKRKQRLSLGIGLIGILLVILIYTNTHQVENKPLNYFYEQTEQNNIAKITFHEKSFSVTTTDGHKFRVNSKQALPYSEQKSLMAKGIIIENGLEPVWLKFLAYILAFFALMAITIYFLKSLKRSPINGPNEFAKSKAKIIKPEQSNISFKNVAGIEEAKADLEELVDFLKNPNKYRALGARVPRGLLMVGPPGSGKTLLAKAVAGEAAVPFYSISGSDFVELYVGVGAARVRDLFATAKKNSPCIIFIDEIDAVGKKRSSGAHNSNDEREQTLNALLVEMDGFNSNQQVIIMAATNRVDVLDSALLRPGRFDRQITVDAPDIVGREAILKIHAQNKLLSKDVNLRSIAKRTPGFVGADLENLLNEAALVAARANHIEISDQDIDEAADRIVMGPAKRSRIISANEKRITAYHEAGHALAAYYLEYSDPIHKITIVPRGQAGGFVMRVASEDRIYASRRMLLDNIAVALAGRVTEELIFKDVTTGAQNDFKQATEIAKKMVTSWGMSEKLGSVMLSEGYYSNNYSEQTAKLIDEEIRHILSQQYNRISDIISSNIEKLESIVAALFERETLNAQEFETLMMGLPLEIPRPQSPIESIQLPRISERPQPKLRISRPEISTQVV